MRGSVCDVVIEEEREPATGKISADIETITRCRYVWVDERLLQLSQPTLFILVNSRYGVMSSTEECVGAFERVVVGARRAGLWFRKHGKLSMTRQTLLLLTVLLLTGCSSQAPFTPQASEIAAVQTATSQSVAPTATRATLSTPSATNAPTSSMELTAVPSPFPAETESLLSKKCDKPWESVPGFDLPDELIEDYGDRGCKLPVLSPNRAYLAYVTLTRQPEQGAGQDGYVDTVRILHTHTGKDQVVRFAEGLSPIDSLEWSPTGQLIIQERLWEGPRVVFVYDPSRDAMVSAMRLDQDGNLEWNSERTAMVAVHSGEYGSDQCIHELGGYDFEHGQPFPDLYAIYGITKTDDPFGIPYGASDALSVEPYGWSKDGKSLWITISRLTLIESTGEYEVGPKQAGALSFSDDGVSFNTLAANPQFDYSFDGGSEPRVVSEPYQPRRCP